MDTFIAPSDDWRSLKEMSEIILKERNVIARLRKRHDRAELFFDLMHKQFLSLSYAGRVRALSAPWCTDPFVNGKHALERNMALSLNSAKTNYGD